MPRQPDLFRQQPSGAELRDTALERFEERERNWIGRARQRMVEHATVQSQLAGYAVEVCSDDVWLLCPPPADCHPSVMGPVFRGGPFVRIGYRASKRPSAHARMISTYIVKEQ